MTEKSVEEVLGETLHGDIQQIAKELVVYLRANDMDFEPGKGYWENQLYWMVKYQGEYICYILVNGTGAEEKFAPFTVWSDDSSSAWYEAFPLDKAMKELAWKHVDFCENCGGSCSPGKNKIIFGKEFHHVCRTTMRFINPDFTELACIKKMVEIRRKDVLKRARGTYVG